MIVSVTKISEYFILHRSDYVFFDFLLHGYLPAFWNKKCGAFNNFGLQKIRFLGRLCILKKTCKKCIFLTTQKYFDIWLFNFGWLGTNTANGLVQNWRKMTFLVWKMYKKTPKMLLKRRGNVCDVAMIFHSSFWNPGNVLNAKIHNQSHHLTTQK